MTRPNRRQNSAFTKRLSSAYGTALRTNLRPTVETLEERRVLTALSGFVYEDVNENLQRDDGDLRIPGVVVFIDANDNGVLDQGGFGLEPDTYNAREILNNSDQLVFPSTTGVDNQPDGIVRASASRVSTTGDLVFGQDETEIWNSETRLRFDFTLNVDSVSIDVAGASGEFDSAAQLDAYDADGQLLASDTIIDLRLGDSGTLNVARDQKDISFVIAHVVGERSSMYFDNLLADNAADELSTITNRGGGYLFSNLPEAEYVVRQVVPDGYEQVAPADSYITPIGDAVAGLDFGNRTSSIGGLVFNDAGEIGTFEPATDTVVAGVGLYLDVNENGLADSRISTVDPGSFLLGQALEYVSDDARVTVADSDNNVTSNAVVAHDDAVVSMDGQIFTRGADEAAWTTDERLRFDLESLASRVQLDFIAASDDGPEQGIMVAFSATNQPIATTTTQLLEKGQRQSLIINRPDFDISHVVAYTVDSADPQGRLDNFEATVVDEPVALSDTNGIYLFKPLESGSYRVGTLPMTGRTITLPNDDSVRQISLSEGADDLEADFGLQTNNDAPVARADVAETVEEGSIPIGVLANDFDPDGEVNEGSIEITQPPANGTATVTANGFINYVPNENFEGTDTLIYTVRDDRAAVSNSGVVTINVTGINDAPVANDDAVAILPADAGGTTSTVINVLINDFDVEGPLSLSSLSIQSQPTNGTATVNSATGTITYTSDGSANDSFTYTVSDSQGVPSEPATVTVSALAAGTAPVAMADNFAALEGTRLDLPVTSNDTDADGTIRTDLISIIQPPQAGSVAISDGVIVYTPVLGFVGQETFSYQVRDNDLLASNTAEISIEVSEREFPYQNPIESLDVNPDGFIIPRDALIIINEINNRRVSDSVTGEILVNPDPGSVPAAYYDVNGDGFVAAIDVLRIINAINNQGNAEPSATRALTQIGNADAAVAAAFASNFDALNDSGEDDDIFA